MSESLEALRRANPRAAAGFAESVEAAGGAVRQLVTTPVPPRRRTVRLVARRSFAISVAGVALALAASALALSIASLAGAPGVEDAAAAMRKAARLSAASARHSGTAVVRITYGGELWAGRTIRWNGEDLSLSGDEPSRAGRAGSRMLLVDGMMYGIDPNEGRWVELGSPASIDPDSGTTPAEYLAALREDVGGTTLRRVTDGMTGLATRLLADGSTVYTGTVRAGVLARETAFKEGRSNRVLPFGYVAHDEASNAASPIDVTVTVGDDGIVRGITATWGNKGSSWTYSVTYKDLGATPSPTAPADVRTLRELRGR